MPQAIISKPTSYFETSLGIKFEKDRDDFDDYDGAAIIIEGYLQFALKHYVGYPSGTTTIYLPFEIGDVNQVTNAIRHVADELRIDKEWIIWQREDDPDL